MPTTGGILRAINGYFTLIGNSYIGSLSRSVWMYDGRQIAAQLDGLIKLPDMEYLEIDAGEGYRWSAGSLKATHTITRDFPLSFQHRDQVFSIGVLKATASLDNIYDRLIGKALTILITNAIRAFFVSGFILLIFQFFVTRHLDELAGHVKEIDLDRGPKRIELKNKKTHEHPDEIDQVVEALNEVQAKLYQSYDALKQSEDELYRIFSMSIDLICIADINTASFIKVNPAFCETLGFSVDELTSKSFLAFVHPDDIEPTRRIIDEQLKAGKKVFNFENRYLCNNGTYKWLRWVSHPVQEKGITYAVAHDITEIRSYIDRLEGSHQRFITVLDSIDCHVYVADMESHEILFVNEKMKRDFGKDLTGRLCWSVFRGEHSPCRDCTNERIVDADGQPADVCVRQVKNPVTGKWYITYERAIQWVDGKTVRIEIAMDITRQKEIEAELRQSHKMEAIGTLAGGIAHEFNNVLAIILGNAELAMDSIPEWNPASGSLKEIRAASLRAKEVVSQILSFARKTMTELKPIEISGIIRESLKLIRASIPAMVEIKAEISSEPFMIHGNATEIHQIVINLCTNAAHAMRKTGGSWK